MKSYKLSVRLMTYNHGNYIEEALKGIDIQKTDFSFEVVVGDDFSTDDTLSKIREYDFTNPNLNLKILERKVGDAYHKERKKKGRLYNFVDILNNCTGDYIALLDGDDYWTDPLKLQKQVDFLEANRDYILTFHPCFTKFGHEEPKKQAFDAINYEYSVENLLSKWGIPTASLVFRNKIRTFPDWFSKVASGDITLVMLLFEKGELKLFSDYMSVYRITANGISQFHKNYRMIHYRAILYSFLNEYFNYKYEKEIYDALHKIYLEFSGIQITTRSKKSFINKIFKLIRG